MIIEQIPSRLTWQLRRDVLYPNEQKNEMGMPEDNNGVHFAAFKDNYIVGVVSLFQSGTDFQFRKLAVDATVQNQGIGGQILEYITAFAKNEGGTRVWCNARTTAINFYLKHGYSQTGNVFVKKGIDYEILEKAITPLSNRQE
jgi:GNAT superfamily N-acetyltransferase